MLKNIKNFVVLLLCLPPCLAARPADWDPSFAADIKSRDTKAREERFANEERYVREEAKRNNDKKRRLVERLCQVEDPYDGIRQLDSLFVVWQSMRLAYRRKFDMLKARCNALNGTRTAIGNDIASGGVTESSLQRKVESLDESVGVFLKDCQELYDSVCQDMIERIVSGSGAVSNLTYAAETNLWYTFLQTCVSSRDRTIDRVRAENTRLNIETYWLGRTNQCLELRAAELSTRNLELKARTVELEARTVELEAEVKQLGSDLYNSRKTGLLVFAMLLICLVPAGLAIGFFMKSSRK